jgi:hypothetical protein
VEAAPATPRASTRRRVGVPELRGDERRGRHDPATALVAFSIQDPYHVVRGLKDAHRQVLVTPETTNAQLAPLCRHDEAGDVGFG